MTDQSPDPGPLESALSAPGTPQELAEREQYLELFRREHAAASAAAPIADVVDLRSRHLVRWLGAGGALAVVLAVGGGGVAAALNGALPAPLQQFSHQVLGPMGVPPAADPTPRAGRRAVDKPSTSAESSPTAKPTRSASTGPSRQPQPRQSTRPTRAPSAAVRASGFPSPSASGSATPSPAAAPTTDPTATPTTPPGSDPTTDPSAVPSPSPGLVIGQRPTDLTTTTDTDRVTAGGRVVLTATVDAGDGSPVARAAVALEQLAGGRWREVATRFAADDGTASLTSGPVTRTTVFRMRSGRVTGRPILVVSLPVLSVDQGPPGRRTTWVTVSAYGGQRGDVVRLMGLRGGRSVVVDQARLNRNGSAYFDVRLTDQTLRYGAVIARTSRHGSSRVDVVLPPRAGTPAPASPAPDPGV